MKKLLGYIIPALTLIISATCKEFPIKVLLGEIDVTEKYLNCNQTSCKLSNLRFLIGSSMTISEKSPSKHLKDSSYELKIESTYFATENSDIGLVQFLLPNTNLIFEKSSILSKNTLIKAKNAMISLSVINYGVALIDVSE